jgi:hypothetical protein
MVAKTKRSPRPLPPALVKRALHAADAKLARFLHDAKADLALIARRKAQIVESFYDIGEALRRLKQKEFVAALGRKSFAEVCAKDAGISLSQAGRLIDIVEHMSRAEALAMGQAKASALVGLAGATPEDDTPGTLLRSRKPLALPGGGTLDTKKASARTIERAAKAIRRATPGKTARGSRVSDEDARAGEALTRGLARVGVRVSVVAGSPGRPATFRFEGVTRAGLARFAAALARFAARAE